VDPPALRRSRADVVARCEREPGIFTWISQMLRDDKDAHIHLADLPLYIEAQEKAGETFRDRDAWTRMSILNVARIGKFSSDRTVLEYARDIWHTLRI
jgi:starch phosphorylase